MTKCFVCDKGTLKQKKEPFTLYGILLGEFDAKVCTQCKEVFFDETAADLMDRAAKKAGVFGLEARTKVGQVGNSLDVKISKQLATFTNIKKGDSVRVYPDGRKKLVIEFE